MRTCKLCWACVFPDTVLLDGACKSEHWFGLLAGSGLSDCEFDIRRCQISLWPRTFADSTSAQLLHKSLQDFTQLPADVLWRAV